VTKNGIFETFCLKAFSVEQLEIPFWENKTLNVFRRVSRSCFLNFDLIGCQSWKECAKSTILNIKVKIRQFKCHQKIPCIRFSGSDISNYGLIFNTADSRKNCFFYKYFVLLSSTVCVENETIVANIVFRESYTRNLLVVFNF
jgi:hypothetical protein